VPRFLPVPVDGRKVLGHDEAVLTVTSPGNGCEFWVKMKQSRWRAKNKAPARLPSPKAGSAGSPIDFVSEAGSVRVPQGFISGFMFNLIDFWGRSRSSPGCRSQLIKPSEL